MPGGTYMHAHARVCAHGHGQRQGGSCARARESNDRHLILLLAPFERTNALRLIKACVILSRCYKPVSLRWHHSVKLRSLYFAVLLSLNIRFVGFGSPFSRHDKSTGCSAENLHTEQFRIRASASSRGMMRGCLAS